MQINRPIQILFYTLTTSILLGCSFLQPRADPTRFYLLNAHGDLNERPFQIEFKRWKVGLMAVELPSYLRGKSIIVRTGTNEIYFADFDRWAEPLDQGISRVLKESLSSAQNVESVAINSRGGDALDYEVSTRVVSCEGFRGVNGNSSTHFAVVWEIRSTATNSMPPMQGVFTADAGVWDGKDYGQLAQRLSEAVVALSKAIVVNLPLEPEPLANLTKQKSGTRGN
jgi:uncharacterized protein